MTNLAFQRKKFPHLTDEEFRFMVQQEEGRARLRDKLPTLVEQADWWFPPRLACEQCSSELTATAHSDLSSSRAPQRRQLKKNSGRSSIATTAPTPIRG